MPYVESASPDITETLPISLGGVASGASAPQVDWDVTFNGLGFNLRPSREAPYQRGTEQSRKQQIDTSESPGEQSLSSWWTRAQDTWDMGAGINWYEPGTEPETYKRFANSQGIDVWTPGEIKLLPKMEATEGNLVAYFQNLYREGQSGILLVGHDVGATELLWVSVDGEGDYYSAEVSGGPEVTRPTTAGSSMWMGVDGGIVHWNLATAPEDSTLSPTYTCTGTPQVWWAKSRLIVALGAALYELAPGAATGALTSVATLIYEHPDTEWQWVAVAETGEAILAAGASGGTSGVFRITIEQDEAGMPVLSGASQVVSLPTSERVSCMGVYLGTVLVLGTSRGIRIGVTNDQGVVQYGPLTVELTQAPSDILFDDRFAYVAVTAALPDGTSGLVRIDLSAPVDEAGRFAWAWDLSAGVTAEAFSISRFVVEFDEPRTVWYMSLEGYSATTTGTSGDEPVDSGWLDTGRIRFGTSEPKAFRLARMVCDTNGGRVRLDATLPSGTEVRVIEFDDSYVTSEQVAIQVPGATNTHQYMSFKMTLTASEDGTATPVVNGLAIKAVPAAARVRLYQYPLSVFDTERNRHGEILTAGRNNAYRRLRALEELEETGAPVTVRDNRTGETFIGQIDTVDFTAPHPPDGAESGFGGVASVVVRRL